MADKNNQPKWATLDRKNHLVALFLRSGGFCVFGHKKCQVPEHHYELFIEGLIKDWKSDDREQSLFEWLAEQKVLHSLGERSYPLRGRFSAISQKIYADNQPVYFIEGLGISGVTLKPFAKVRISSTYMRLYVDLGDTLRGVSKTKRRKAIRYGKPLPKLIEANVALIVREAVKHYRTH